MLARRGCRTGLQLAVVLGATSAALGVALPLPSSRGSPRLSLQDFGAIAVAADASAPERFAAGQLADWLGRILPPPGIPVVNVTRGTAPTLSCIAVGAGAAAALLPAGTLEQLANSSEAFLIKVVPGGTDAAALLTGRALVLTGGIGQPRGALNAVFEFLRGLGFRFWNPTTAGLAARVTLPLNASARLPLPAAVERLFYPPVEYRLYNAQLVSSGDRLWRVQNHMSGAMDGELPALPDHMGGGSRRRDCHYTALFLCL